jgi:hypothetical protein
MSLENLVIALLDKTQDLKQQQGVTRMNRRRGLRSLCCVAMWPM